MSERGSKPGETGSDKVGTTERTTTERTTQRPADGGNRPQPAQPAKPATE